MSANLAALLYLASGILFIFALLGMQLFGGVALSSDAARPHFHFDSFAPAMIST